MTGADARKERDEHEDRLAVISGCLDLVIEARLHNQAAYYGDVERTLLRLQHKLRRWQDRESAEWRERFMRPAGPGASTADLAAHSVGADVR